MRHSLRVALAQINPIVGDLEGNARKVVDWIGRAREQHADVVCFPELVLTGYPPEDLVLKRSFVRDNLDQLARVTTATKGITAVVGFVDDDGATFNAAANAVLEEARGYGSNDFKILLTRRTLRAVLVEATGT